MAFKIKDGFMIGSTSIFDSSARLATSSPLSADSTTVVTNLNADLLDGQHGSYYLNYKAHEQIANLIYDMYKK